MSQSSEADKLPAVLCDVSEQSAALESVTPPESGLTSVEPRISGNAPEMEHVIRVYSRQQFLMLGDNPKWKAPLSVAILDLSTLDEIDPAMHSDPVSDMLHTRLPQHGKGSNLDDPSLKPGWSRSPAMGRGVDIARPLAVRPRMAVAGSPADVDAADGLEGTMMRSNAAWRKGGEEPRWPNPGDRPPGTPGTEPRSLQALQTAPGTSPMNTDGRWRTGAGSGAAAAAAAAAATPAVTAVPIKDGRGWAGPNALHAEERGAPAGAAHHPPAAAAAGRGNWDAPERAGGAAQEEERGRGGGRMGLAAATTTHAAGGPGGGGGGAHSRWGNPSDAWDPRRRAGEPAHYAAGGGAAGGGGRARNGEAWDAAAADELWEDRSEAVKAGGDHAAGGFSRAAPSGRGGGRGMTPAEFELEKQGWKAKELKEAALKGVPNFNTIFCDEVDLDELREEVEHQEVADSGSMAFGNHNAAPHMHPNMQPPARQLSPASPGLAVQPPSVMKLAFQQMLAAAAAGKATGEAIKVDRSAVHLGFRPESRQPQPPGMGGRVPNLPGGAQTLSEIESALTGGGGWPAAESSVPPRRAGLAPPPGFTLGLAPPPGFSFPNKDARPPTDASTATGWGAQTFAPPAWGMTAAAAAPPTAAAAQAPANPGRALMGLLQKNNNNNISNVQQPAMPPAPPAFYGEPTPSMNQWVGGQPTAATAPSNAMSHEQGLWSTIGAMMSSASLSSHTFAPERAEQNGLQQQLTIGMQGGGIMLPSQAYPAFSSGAAMWGGQDGLGHVLPPTQQQQHPANAAAPLLQMLQQSSGSSGLTSASSMTAAAASSTPTLSLLSQPKNNNIPAGVLSAFGGSGGGAGKAADKPAANLGHSIWASTAQGGTASDPWATAAAARAPSPSLPPPPPPPPPILQQQQQPRMAGPPGLAPPSSIIMQLTNMQQQQTVPPPASAPPPPPSHGPSSMATLAWMHQHHQLSPQPPPTHSGDLIDDNMFSDATANPTTGAASPAPVQEGQNLQESPASLAAFVSASSQNGSIKNEPQHVYPHNPWDLGTGSTQLGLGGVAQGSKTEFERVAEAWAPRPARNDSLEPAAGAAATAAAPGARPPMNLAEFKGLLQDLGLDGDKQGEAGTGRARSAAGDSQHAQRHLLAQQQQQQHNMPAPHKAQREDVKMAELHRTLLASMQMPGGPQQQQQQAQLQAAARLQQQLQQQQAQAQQHDASQAVLRQQLHLHLMQQQQTQQQQQQVSQQQQIAQQQAQYQQQLNMQKQQQWQQQFANNNRPLQAQPLGAVNQSGPAGQQQASGVKPIPSLGELQAFLEQHQQMQAGGPPMSVAAAARQLEMAAQHKQQAAQALAAQQQQQLALAQRRAFLNTPAAGQQQGLAAGTDPRFPGAGLGLGLQQQQQQGAGQQPSDFSTAAGMQQFQQQQQMATAQAQAHAIQRQQHQQMVDNMTRNMQQQQQQQANMVELARNNEQQRAGSGGGGAATAQQSAQGLARFFNAAALQQQARQQQALPQQQQARMGEVATLQDLERFMAMQGRRQ